MARDFKTGGRKRGTPNAITRFFREAVQVAYDAIGGDDAFAKWARENPGEFYRIAARLIPVQVNSTDERMVPTLTIVTAETPRLPAERDIVSSTPALNAP